MTVGAKPLIALAVSLFIAGGCVQSDTFGTHAVLVTSQPPGAEIQLDSKPAGATPATVQLQRVDSHNIVVSMPGYNNVRAHIPPEIVRDSYLGMGVIDLVRASEMQPMPDKVDIVMEPTAPGAKPQTTTWIDPDLERRKHDKAAIERSQGPTNP